MHHRRQQGAMYSKLFTLAMLGVAVLVGLRVFPIYMDELKASSAFKAVAESPEARLRTTTVTEMRKMLQARWDIDDIQNLKVSDVKFVKTKDGKVMRYSYEVRTGLFANWALVISFENEVPIGAGS